MATTCATRGQRGTAEPRRLTDDDLIVRLHKIEGQVRGVEAMIERHVRCAENLDQIASIHGALHSVAIALVDERIRRDMQPVHGGSPPSDDRVIGELMRSVERLVRS